MPQTFCNQQYLKHPSSRLEVTAVPNSLRRRCNQGVLRKPALRRCRSNYPVHSAYEVLVAASWAGITFLSVLATPPSPTLRAAGEDSPTLFSCQTSRRCTFNNGHRSPPQLSVYGKLSLLYQGEDFQRTESWKRFEWTVRGGVIHTAARLRRLLQSRTWLCLIDSSFKQMLARQYYNRRWFWTQK